MWASKCTHESRQHAACRVKSCVWVTRDIHTCTSRSSHSAIYKASESAERCTCVLLVNWNELQFALGSAFQTALVLQRVFTLGFVAQAQSCATDLRQVHTYERSGESVLPLVAVEAVNTKKAFVKCESLAFARPSKVKQKLLSPHAFKEINILFAPSVQCTSRNARCLFTT